MQTIETAKFSGLVLTQIIGVASTAALLGHTLSYADITPKHCWKGFIALGILFILICTAFIFSPLTPFELPEYFDLRRSILVFAPLDLIVLWICLCISGGSEKSFAVPFLFIITPMILLMDKDLIAEAIFALIIAIIVYAIGFNWKCDLKVRAGKKPHHYRFTLLLATVACAIFPVVYVAVEKRSTPKTTIGTSTHMPQQNPKH